MRRANSGRAHGAWSKRRWVEGAWLTAGAALLSSLAFARTASAQAHLPEEDWRQADRGDHYRVSGASPQNFEFELRFAPYYPDVDSGVSGTPYHTVFGDSARFYIGLELDWQAIRIPYLGVIGPGFGWGYTQASRAAPRKDTYGATTDPDAIVRVDEDTSLTIMPMHLSAVLRADEFLRRWDIPFVPYAKLGIAMATWSASNESGTSSVTASDGTAVQGKGITWGYNFAVGASFCLNFLDEHSATRLDESTGVNHSYLFAEMMDARLDGFGSTSQMHVGTSTWVAGLSADF